jgi:hypothetical protein
MKPVEGYKMEGKENVAIVGCGVSSFAKLKDLGARRLRILKVQDGKSCL